MISRTLVIAATALAVGTPVFAQESDGPHRAIGTDVALSTDSDDTTIVRLGANFDWRYRNDEEYLGLRVERTWYETALGGKESDERLFVRAAGALNADWKYKLNVGTDFHTLLGSVSVHDNSTFRKEFFLEREKVETAEGVRRPIISTYGGAAVDIPLSDKAQITVLGGLQEFTGSNLRTHLRANAIYVVKPEWGLSLQLRTRYWHNSRPDEYDYYSPRWYGQVLPVVQVRRFTETGWRWTIAGGLGAERDSRSGWRQSRYASLRFSSAADRKGWSLNGEAIYSNTPVANSSTYNYGRFSLGLTRIF